MTAPEVAATPVEAAAKAIKDLDDLIGAMLRSIRLTKPWQRALLAHLSEADREAEVLRLSIILERSDDEIRAAAEHLQNTLALIDSQVTRGRANAATKAAIRLPTSYERRPSGPALLASSSCVVSAQTSSSSTRFASDLRPTKNGPNYRLADPTELGVLSFSVHGVSPFYSGSSLA